VSTLDPKKRVERLRAADPKRASDDMEGRVPPGQYLTTKFPVLTYGDTPRIDLKQWRFKVWGLVENPIELTWEQFRAFPAKEIICDLHCVTRWSQLNMRWKGVPFSEIAKVVKPKPEAKFVMEHSFGGYSTNIPLNELFDDDVLLAFNYGGQPVPVDHGGPMRMLAPKLYLWKSAKWLRGLEFIAEDKAGFWEMYGYHMHGDPWTEERFG